MVYGGIGLRNDLRVSDDLLNIISEELSWNSCHNTLIKYGSFSGVHLYDLNLSFIKNDFIYIDKYNEILVCLDGFIYNKEDISNKLPSKNLARNSPQLICEAFLLFGESFVSELNGDFIICIYQKKINKVFFFRDHLGIRPLAICRIGQTVYFSSDIFGFSKALFSRHRIDPKFLLNLFITYDLDYTVLPNNNVERVKPGHYMCFQADCQSKHRYWDLTKIEKDNHLSFHKVKDDLEFLLKDAIKIRSDKRFNASSHLSGGLDSGIVAVLARKEFADQPKFYGFSWTPGFSMVRENIKDDERLLINDICNLYKITPYYSNYTFDDYFSFMSNWRCFSEYVCENEIIKGAQLNKINLIFSGWGGDEFLSFGNRGIDFDLIREWNWATFLRKYPLSRPKRLISALIFNVIFPASVRSYLRYKTDPFIFRFIKNGLKHNLLPADKIISSYSRRQIHLQLLESNHLSARCEDWYVNGQHSGIEYRYPLLDKRIVEYMLKVPSKYLVEGSNNRVIMRNIGKNVLPERVLINVSKEDPVKDMVLRKLGHDALVILIKEISDFKDNSDLDFVDFDKLNETIRQTTNDQDKDNLILILFSIKRAHEFTKGFYS
jgi:asparagine synthase (glutamine-hydrolysing)